jgi:alcohol dehydrogenase, propanol-preferring
MPLPWDCASWLSASLEFSALSRLIVIVAIVADTGEDKKKLSLDLGAESFIDFELTKDLVKDIKHRTGDEGAHAAVITAANVSPSSYIMTILLHYVVQPAAYAQAIDYLRCGGTLVAVGLPGGAKLGADIFFTVYKVSAGICNG